MADIASLGIAIDTRQVTRAREELGRFAGAAKTAESAAGGMAARVGNDFNRLERANAAISNSFTGVTRSVGLLQAAFAILSSSLLGYDFVRVVTALDSTRKGFEAVFGSTRAAQKELAFVRGEVDRLGLQLSSTAKAYLNFAASSKGTALEGAEAQRIFSAIATSMSVLGKTMPETEGALLAVSQMMSKGTVSAEELRGQLGERLPGAFNMMAQALGVSTQRLGKMLEQGEVLASTALPKLAAVLEQRFGRSAANGIDSLAANFNRLRTAVEESYAAIGDAGGTDAINRIVKAAEVMVQTFAQSEDLVGGIVSALQGVAGLMEEINRLAKDGFWKFTADNSRANPGMIDKWFPGLLPNGPDATFDERFGAAPGANPSLTEALNERIAARNYDTRGSDIADANMGAQSALGVAAARWKGRVPIPGANPLKSLGEDPYADRTEAARRAQELARETVAGLRFEQEQMARTNVEQRIYNELKSAGVERNSAFGMQIESLVVSIERQRQAIEDLDEVRSTADGVLSGFLSDLREGVSLWDALGNAANRVLDAMLNRLSSNLVDALFGEKGTAGTGLIGQLFGFGGNPSVVSNDNTPGAPIIPVNVSPLGPLGASPSGSAAAAAASLGAGVSTAGAGIVGDSLVSRSYAPAGGGIGAFGGGGGGLPLLYGPNWRPGGVDPRLISAAEATAAQSQYQWRLNSGMRSRSGGGSWHQKGKAIDFELIDPTTGKALPDYQDATYFREYEIEAQRMRANLLTSNPELAGQERWGGYFSGKKNYGAMDLMHFDLGGSANMAGGSWAGGLNERQRKLWPEAVSVGLGAGAPVGAADPSAAINAASASAQAATQSFAALGGTIGQTTPQVGGLGQAIGSLFGGGAPAVPGAAGGGILDGFMNLFSGGFAGGGKIGAGRWGIVGETGPELAFGGHSGLSVAPNAAANNNGPQVIVQNMDQRRGGAPIETESRRGPNGEVIIRNIVRDENVKSNAPGGLNDKSDAAKGLRRGYVKR